MEQSKQQVEKTKKELKRSLTALKRAHRKLERAIDGASQDGQDWSFIAKRD